MNRWVATWLVLAWCGIPAFGWTGSARADWYSLDGAGPAEPEVTVQQRAAGVTGVEVVPHGFAHDRVEIDGREHVSLRVPGQWFLLDEGQPELPFLSLRLEIPDKGDPAVRVVESIWREIPFAPPVPSKGNVLRNVDPDLVAWSFGPGYDSGVYPAAATELGSPFILRDRRGVGLRVSLLRWDATRGVLLALERLVLEVETSGLGGVNEKTGKPALAVDPQFEQLYRLGFDNYLGAEKYNQVSVDGPLLIVAPAEFLPALGSFVQWKRQRGLRVETLTTESLGAAAEDIRAGIQAAVDARYESAAGLTYLILVGDLEQVPSNRGVYEWALDDTHYGCVEGDDSYPDLFVSRISAATTSEVQTQVNKFVHYERDPDPAGQWFDRAAGLASNQGIPTDYVRAGWLRDDLLSYHFRAVDEIYAPTALTADIVAAVNEGRSLINYLGHGSGTAWSNPYLDIDDIHALQNGWKTPWILDVSCNNGDFQWAECFAEAWMRAGTPEQPQGAIAIYSASTTTPWVPPCVMQAEAVDLLVNEQANVIGSLYTHGIMEVLDTYPGDEGLQLVEQYNIFGDCSLVVRTDQPLPLNVQHPAAIPLGALEFPVRTDLAGATVALTSRGVLHGVGVTDPLGDVILDLALPVSEPGTVTLTVTGYNRVPFMVDLPTTTAQGYLVEPASLPVGETTQVTVTLWDAAKAVSDVEVRISGFGVAGLETLTGPDGIAIFDVTPRYGETLRVAGRQPGALFDLFAQDLPVTGGIPLTAPAISSNVPIIGLLDTLAINLEGVIAGSAVESGLTLGLEYFDSLELFTSAGDSVAGSLVPSWPGFVRASLMKDGYSIFTREFVVFEGKGTLAGTVVDVDADSAGVYDARVFGFLAGQDAAGVPAFDVRTDYLGRWTVPGRIPLGYYDYYVEALGYLEHSETGFLTFGSNVVTLSVDQSPRGLVTGSVVSAEDGAALFTRVEAFRADTGQQVAEAWSSGAGGAFALPPLPYFEYDILVSPTGFTPRKQRVVVDQPLRDLAFALERTSGSILVIDDSRVRSAADEVIVAHPVRVDKTGAVLAAAYSAPASRSALAMLIDLVNIGYDVTYSLSTGYEAASWSAYDLVVVSCADWTETLSPGLTADLVAHVAAGGKLLIEGGDVAYEHVTDGTFAREVLHIDGWVSDSPGDVGVYQALHPVMSYPNPLPARFGFNDAGSGSSDAVTARDDAVMAASWTNSWSDASIVCYGPESLLGAGQTVFFAFDYAGLAADGRVDLLHNAVHWLVVPEAGLASVSGRVELLHAADAADVTLRLSPGNRAVVTGPDGVYSFDRLYAGEYTLTVTRPNWTSESFSFGLTQEQQMTGVDFELSDVMTVEYWDDPALVIPDNDPAGVTCTLANTLNERATRVEVFLDITHPYLADLVIDLVGPSGTTVRLHQNNGGDGDDIHAWYPTELPSYGVLDNFIGESIYGAWSLHVVDCGPFDEGVVNRWGLRLTYAAGLTPAGGDDLPPVVSLEDNRPNPFNPVTEISFSVPRETMVELAVFDLAGRRLAVLVDGFRTAGRYSAAWDGCDITGQAVASGTYFYRLRTEEGAVTGKMLLVK